MTRKAAPESPRVSAHALSTVPSEEHAALALREGAVLMAPIAQWLLRSGVSYTAFVDMLKPIFLHAARAELERAGKGATQSALSVLSGVHRKDVRALTDNPGAPPSRTSNVPLPSQVFTRWLSDRRFCQRDGRPKTLRRNGSANSFESLSRELSQDVHPRTILDELLRLGLVQLDGDDVVPLETAFVPSRQLNQMTGLLAANVADHLAAGVHNLTVDGQRFLEQSVFADGLSADSVQRLHDCARQAWGDAFAAIVAEANQRVTADERVAQPQEHRIRFGVYYFSEPTANAPSAKKAGRSVTAAAAPRKRVQPARRSK